MIHATCQPRADILTGSFNPEIFTASLSQVMDCYRGRATPTHTLYTDAEQFFREVTYPTEGLRMALAEVFGRLAGDNSVPAIHRLETAFGGGKTHTLIALTHLGCRGRDLTAVTGGIIDAALLPIAGSVTVVGVAGDEFRYTSHRARNWCRIPCGGRSPFKSVGSPCITSSQLTQPRMRPLAAMTLRRSSGQAGC